MRNKQSKAKNFREHHLLKILEDFSSVNYPLDFFLSRYFRANKSVGANDRRFISDTVYGLIRWLGLVDFICQTRRTNCKNPFGLKSALLPSDSRGSQIAYPQSDMSICKPDEPMTKSSNFSSEAIFATGSRPLNWEERIKTFLEIDPSTYLSHSAIPPHIRVSFPKDFFELFVQAFGETRALELCYASNFPAPTTIRTNALKTDRSTLLEKWQGIFSVSPGSSSPHAIIFHRKTNFFALPEFKEGFFEVQDEASQLIADLVQAKPGQQVLDFCAGSGGKTLAFAPRLKGKGQIYLHDIRPQALEEAKKRMRRAGIQNAQILLANAKTKEALQEKMDWVLVDAPCSGTGTLRRNPDMKWKFSPGDLSDLITLQRAIFVEALSFVRPGGHIVYATCSVLPQENLEQAIYFQETLPVNMIGTPFNSFPQNQGMDGFFGVVFVKN